MKIKLKRPQIKIKKPTIKMAPKKGKSKKSYTA